MYCSTALCYHQKEFAKSLISRGRGRGVIAMGLVLPPRIYSSPLTPPVCCLALMPFT